MRIILTLLLLLSVTAYAQKVPSKMEFAGLKLNLSDKLRDDLQKEVDMLTRSPKYFQIKVDRAKIYFPVIEKIFAEEGVPDDIKYLVLQESALIPDAVSVSDAVGYWQFKDFTAMEMGMRIDRQVDERMHIVASSYGAARYFKKNNSFFDNWLYALQAYQMGAGGALKVVNDKYYGAKSMDLDHKTYWYVKKFLAHKIAFESAVEGDGKTILNIYPDGANKSLKEIARETSVDYDQLLAYNIWLKSNRIPGDKNYPVVLPAGYGESGIIEDIEVEIEKAEPSVIPEKIIIAEENNYPVFGTRKLLFSSEEIKTINGIPGIVGKDEKTLIDLASRADISLSKFMRVNDLEVKDQPQEGQVYYLKRKKAKAPTYYHIVKPDENLWEISQRYGVRLNKLLLKNRLRSKNDIKPGLVLWLRHVRPESVPAEYKEVKEEVKNSSLISTETEKKTGAKKHRQEKIIDEDPAEVQTDLKTSQKVSIAEPEKETAPEPATEVEETPGANSPTENAKEDQIFADSSSQQDEDEKAMITKKDSSSNVLDDEKYVENVVNMDTEEAIEHDNLIENSRNFINHKVEPGETFYSISKKYNVDVVDIINWNNFNINDKLAIGQEIKILQVNPIDDQKEVVDLQSDASLQEGFYEVKDGDTLYQIARKYKVTIQELMEWNGKENYSLSAGEKLVIKK